MTNTAIKPKCIANHYVKYLGIEIAFGYRGVISVISANFALYGSLVKIQMLQKNVR